MMVEAAGVETEIFIFVNSRWRKTFDTNELIPGRLHHMLESPWLRGSPLQSTPVVEK
jgi:hypothetical protein